MHNNMGNQNKVMKEMQLPLGEKWNPVKYLLANTHISAIEGAVKSNDMQRIWGKFAGNLIQQMPELYKNERAFGIAMGMAFRKYEADRNEIDSVARQIKGYKRMYKGAKYEKRHADAEKYLETHNYLLDQYKRLFKPYEALYRDHKKFKIQLSGISG